MALRGVNSRGVLLLSALLSGCSLYQGRALRTVPEGEWTATLGSAQRSPFALEQAPETPEEQWRRDVEKGILSTPVVHGHLLIVPSTARSLTLVSAEDGGRYWQRRFNGPVTGPALRLGDRVFVATASRDGRVYGYELQRGRKQWQTRVRSPVTADPVLARDRVLVSSLRGELYALHVDDGRILWRTRLPGAQAGAPVLDGDAVVLATARDTLVRVATADGRVLAQAALPGTPSAPLSRRDSTVLVPLHPGMVVHYSLPRLEPLRADTLGAPVLAAPVVAEDGTTFVLTAAADVWRLDATGAHRIASLGGTARESLTLARNGLLVGRLDGTLFLLRRDGSEVWRREFEGPLRAPVVLSDGAAYVTLQNGEMVKLR